VKILITNIVTMNVGDAAILYAMIDVMRNAFGDNTHFIVYDKHGDVPKRYYPDLEYRRLLYHTRESMTAQRGHPLFRRLDDLRFKVGLRFIKQGIPLLPHIFLNSIERRDLLEYKTADLIVSSGGTYLVENYSMAARIFDYQISLYLERPLVFFTQSLGPFSNPENREALRPIFDESVAILVRDEQSRRNLDDLGVENKNVHVVADAAFALSDLEALESAKLRVLHPGKRLRVAISVREWKYFKTVEPAQGMSHYYEALRALSEHLVERYDAEITYLSTCQGMPEYWTDDSRVAQKIVDGLSPNTRESVSVDSDFHSPAVLARTLKDYDLVIATRMHMAILALSVGTPVLPIAYEFKMRELFERLAQERWVQDIEAISPDALIDAADRFLEALPDIRETLFTAVQKEYENAVASGHLVRQAFEEWRRAREK
jgi:colanic acid/amylovoran biosynthesis protein WcaK/AmsJ